MGLLLFNQTAKIKSILTSLGKKSRGRIKRFFRGLGLKKNHLTASFRMLPRFIIIGAMKCGTSSLYRHMVEHPCILPARRKEVHYFDDTNYSQGINWYKAHFPLSLYASIFKWRNGLEVISGEASPYYLAFPLSPERISKVLPDVKLIAMLRNPTDRAYSHYHHQVRHGREPLSFEEAIDAEQERLHGERNKILRDDSYYSFNFWAYSYLTRGVYIDQIEFWMKYFSKDRLLILKSEDFFSSPEREFKKTLNFLDLPDYKLRVYPKVNTGSYDEMPSAIRQKLNDYFRPYNERLYEWIWQDYKWC